MRRLILLSLAAGAALLAGCSDSPTNPLAASSALAPAGPPPPFNAHGFTILTRNIYLGANLDPVLLATDPNQVPVFAGQIYGQLIGTDFPARAGRLAREITRNHPQLVGLQEVALWRVQTGPNPFAPATTVAFDFLQELLDSLAAQGASYTVAMVQQGADAQLPAVVAINPLTIVGVRLTEREAILARHDVQTWDPTGGNYAAAVQIQLGPMTIPELRSWASVRARVERREIRFVTTHLEQQRSQAIQVAQAQELIDLLANDWLPVVLVGDFNSAADGSQTPTYGMIRGAGYADLWSLRYPHEPGYTCCQADDLLNTDFRLDQRLDIIFVHDPFSHAARGLSGPIAMQLLDRTLAERTPSGLWPSDHAGVIASLALPPLGVGH